MKKHINPEAAKYHQSRCLKPINDIWSLEKCQCTHKPAHNLHSAGIALISMQRPEFCHCFEHLLS